MKTLLRCFIMAAFFAILLPSAQVFANDIDTNTPDEKLEPGKLIEFKITGGLDTEKENEATFDEYRTVTGTASKNTVITITVLTPVSPGEKTEENTDNEDTGKEENKTNAGNTEKAQEDKTSKSAEQEKSEESDVLSEQESSGQSDKTDKKESEDKPENKTVKIDGAEYLVKEEPEIVVSGLKIFSKDIKLSNGENRIIIKAVKNNVYQTYEFTVNKKDIEIKKELEKGTRVIPLTENQQGE